MMIVEYKNMSPQKHLAMVTHYIDPGSVIIAFLEDIQLPNGLTIYSSMKGFLSEQTSIPLTSTTSFAGDGP